MLVIRLFAMFLLVTVSSFLLVRMAFVGFVFIQWEVSDRTMQSVTDAGGTYMVGDFAVYLDLERCGMLPAEQLEQILIDQQRNSELEVLSLRGQTITPEIGVRLTELPLERLDLTDAVIDENTLTTLLLPIGPYDNPVGNGDLIRVR